MQESVSSKRIGCELVNYHMYDKRHWLTEQVDAQQATLAAQSERAHLTKLCYENTVAPYLEVLDAERACFTAAQAFVQARGTLLSGDVNLFAALGGGAPDKAL